LSRHTIPLILTGGVRSRPVTSNGLGGWLRGTDVEGTSTIDCGRWSFLPSHLEGNRKIY
jgi:hypothetical protein